MSTLTTRNLRSLAADEEFASDDESYTLFGHSNDYYSSSDDGLWVPPWALFLFAIFVSALIGGVILYCSYKHEWCKKESKAAKQDKGDEEEAEEEGKPKLAIKTFQDSKLFDRAQSATAVADATPDATATTTCDTRLDQLVTVPRCVLCSANFEVGEDVTHSSNPACHHEYHEKCLRTHWTKKSTKKQKLDDKCPVCKQTYAIADLSPSKHFSTIHFSSHQHHTHTDAGTHEQPVAPFSSSA